MATCEGLQHIFEKPLPESPTLYDPLSPWKHIQSLDNSSFTETFGEFHFKENTDITQLSTESVSSPSASSPSTELNPDPSTVKPNERSESQKSPTSYFPSGRTRHYRDSGSFSSMTSDSLSLCTESLGFESSDDVEDSKSDSTIDWNSYTERRNSHCTTTKNTQSEFLPSRTKRSRINSAEFPPPISSISRSGKPRVCFKSYRTDGRFVLKEVRLPTQELLHARREDGRLKLHFIKPDNEVIEEEHEEEDDEKEYEGRSDEIDELNCRNEEDEEEKDGRNAEVEGK